MKSDLDRLMQDRALDAIVVACDTYFNAPREYLTGGVKITTGLVLKKRGAAPVIFANAMEVDEAARTGLQVYSFNDLGWPQLLKDANGDHDKAEVVFWGRALEKIDVPSGKIGVYGISDLNIILELGRMLNAAYAQYDFVGETGMTVFDEAYATKDADEQRRIREVARKTNEVLQETWDFVRAQRVEHDALVSADGSPFTIADVKRFVRRALLERDLEDHGMIFAQGRDAGFPHSRGEGDTQLRLGESIIFDLFPSEAGGGYHHDVTRTWCLGRAPDNVRQAYEQVMEAFDIAVETARPGVPTKAVQEAIQTYFESKGHPTSRSQPGTTEGFVHSIGHGIGMKIHERPSMGHLSKDTLQKGNVITIEPGLYYPERGFGVRVEDTYLIDGEGQLVSLTPFRKDLVIPLG